MGKIYDYNGIEIVIYTNDHNPPHVHVTVGDKCELKVELRTKAIHLVSGKLPNTKVLKMIMEEIEDNRKEIGQTWRKYHGN